MCTDAARSSRRVFYYKVVAMTYLKWFLVCGLLVLTLALNAWAAGVSDGVVVVQQGQNLNTIAAQHKVSVAQLCQWNNLASPDKIRVGQKLYVRPPDAATTAQGVTTASVPPAAPTAPTPEQQTKKQPAHAAPAPSSVTTASPSPAPIAPAPQKQTKQAKKTTPEPEPVATNPVEMYAPAGVPENIKLELGNVGRTLVNNAAKSIMPNIKAKAVAPEGSGGFVAKYVEVDATNIRTEVIPSSESGKYVGSIRYVENQYECPGKSKAEALQATCHLVKSRRMNELIRYEKGKWYY